MLVPRLGAHPDDGGTSFAVFSRGDAVELCLLDDDGGQRVVPAHRADARRLARVRRGRPARPALRLPGARPVGPRARAPLQPRQAARRPVRPGAGRGAAARPVGARPRPGRRRLGGRRARLGRVRPALGRRRPDVRLAGRPAARGAVGRHGRLRAAREGLHGGAPRCARRNCAARTPGWRIPLRSSTSSGSASRRSSCCRCTTSPASRCCSGAAGTTTGATTRSASSRRTPATRRPARAGSR